MQICPNCNGLDTFTIPCPHCSTPLSDEGKVSDYYGPYSPYREIAHLQTETGSDPIHLLYCEHYLLCPHCQTTYRFPIKRLDSPLLHLPLSD